MKYLMKYEFRKTRASKAAVLIFSGILEILFLLGILTKSMNMLVLGSMGLAVCATFGMFVLGLMSIFILHRELNSTQSYMLFMTPNSSWKILGAKILENGITLAIGGIFFVLLAGVDMFLWSVRALNFSTTMEILSTISNTGEHPDLGYVAALLAVLFCAWLCVIAIAFFAVVLQATLLNGRRGGWLVSFLIFLAISIVIAILFQNLLYPNAPVALYILFFLGFTALFYAVTGWLMDHKLSV